MTLTESNILGVCRCLQEITLYTHTHTYKTMNSPRHSAITATNVQVYVFIIKRAVVIELFSSKWFDLVVPSALITRLIRSKTKDIQTDELTLAYNYYYYLNTIDLQQRRAIHSVRVVVRTCFETGDFFLFSSRACDRRKTTSFLRFFKDSETRSQ